MAVDDFSIYGIPASLFFSLVSLGISFLAVYFSFRQAKISHDQFELELRKVEKPRVLEKIQNALNGIKNEMEQELYAIKKKEMVWVIENEQNNIYVAPLVFPISKMKNFNSGFQKLFTGPEATPTEDFTQKISRIDQNLKKRHAIYKSIDRKLYFMEKYIKQNENEARIKKILLKLRTFSIERDVNNEKNLIIYKTDENRKIKVNTIPKIKLQDIINSMIISAIFKRLKKNEFRLGCLGYSDLVNELFPQIANSIFDQPLPESEIIKKQILSNLTNLKELDESILTDIISMKEIYGKKYILTDAELDPYQGI